MMVVVMGDRNGGSDGHDGIHSIFNVFLTFYGEHFNMYCGVSAGMLLLC